MMPNYTMNEIMYENLCRVTPTEFTDEEKKFMDDMVATHALRAIAAACKRTDSARRNWSMACA